MSRKQGRIFNFERCRTCNHYFISHTSKCVYCFDNAELKLCGCEEFSPSDNIDFLEYEYGKLDKKFSD